MNIHEAKTHFSRLVAQVEGGKEILITRSGVPVARLVPVHRTGRRVPGGWEGRVRVSPDFDVLDDETLVAFEGGRT